MNTPSRLLSSVALGSLLALALWVVAPPVTAGLYDSRVPVSDEAVDSRNAAIAAGLDRVLVKLTGRREVLAEPAAEAVRALAPQLVQQFRYQTDPESGERWLEMGFDEAALQSALRANALRPWVGPRPRTLVWLVGEVQGRRTMLGAENAPVLLDVVRAAAADRGLPVILPLLDLQDQASLTAADLWNGFAERILAASARYAPDAVLVGRLSTRGERVRGRWDFYPETAGDSFESAGPTPDAVLSAGLDAAADDIALRYAPAIGGAVARVPLAVSGIGGVEAYAGLTTLLSRAGSVTETHLRRADGDRLWFDIAAETDAAGLQRELLLGGRLAPEAETVVPPGSVMAPATGLRLRWLQ